MADGGACRSCGVEREAGTTACANCGAFITPKPIGIGIFFGIILLGGIAGVVLGIMFAVSVNALAFDAAARPSHRVAARILVGVGLLCAFGALAYGIRLGVVGRGELALLLMSVAIGFLLPAAPCTLSVFSY
jgi:hypothetical protein